MSKYEAIIGIETHVQLATKTKLFCGCNNDARDAEPNKYVCPVCTGMPGALPVLNEAAVKLALRAGHALNAYSEMKEFHSKFDRKNYFYPDSPMNYQITQFDEPIIGQGYVEFPVNGATKRVGVTRAHLEADAGKLIHPTGVDYSLVDLNRAGTPLIEIVSEPDIRSAEEAKAYAQELYNLMRYAGVSDANLYYGNMRFDVNVSLREVGTDKYGTRTESKNLNSFRAVAGVVEYETKRQAELLDRGEKIVQETRGWDENKGVTFSQRTKEEAHDYRYFPEPDLPPLMITKEMLATASAAMPKVTLNEMRSSFGEINISPELSEVLIDHQWAQLLYEIQHTPYGPPGNAAERVVTWLVSDIPNFEQQGIGDARKFLNKTNLVELAELVDKGKVSYTASRKILAELVVTGGEPVVIAEKKQLFQVSDTDELEKIVDQVIADNPKPVEDYKAGEERALGFLVGQVMKASKGQANPPMVNDILKKKLGA
jgi:aspartyl-tRNA(Asn)/glutamyl-tRNA(Gln) amidotransferase subunit B